MLSDTQPKGWSISPKWMVSIAGISKSAGKEIALNLKLAETTENLLQYDFTQNG